MTTKLQKNEDIISLLKGVTPQYGTTVAEAIEHLEHEIDLIVSKNQTSAMKRQATKQEEQKLRDEVLTCLQNSIGMTATEVYVMCNLKSSQKATALLSELIADGKVERVKEKNKSIYKAI